MKKLIRNNKDLLEFQAQLFEVAQELTKGKQFDVEIKEHREKRSLNANSYFHLLIHEIAEQLHIGNEECKIKMNLEYGTPLKIDSNTLFAFKVPKGSDVSNIVKYPKYIRTDIDKNKEVDIYMVYKETHTLDTKEMARLIDGVVEEAKALGIQTLDDIELKSLLSKWQNN